MLHFSIKIYIKKKIRFILEMNGENDKLKENIWNIRNYIQKLEDIKDEIIDYLNLLKELDDLNRNLWISDVKELYYNTVSAWEMLRPTRKIEFKNIDNSNR